MKSCISGVRQLLIAHIPLLGLVPEERIKLMVSTQGADYPDIVMYPVSGFPGEQLSGTNGIWERRISVECRSPIFGDCDEIGELVIAALPEGRSFVDCGTFQSCIPVGDTSFWDETSNMWRRILDFRIQHSA